MFWPGLPFDVQSGQLALSAILLCMYVYIDKVYHFALQPLSMKELHGKYNFTSIQSQNIRNNDKKRVIDIKCRANLWTNWKRS
jgi:hypothetical protein